MTGLATVHDLDAARRYRFEARTRILQAANRIRLGRSRYARTVVSGREHGPVRLLTMRHMARCGC